MCQLPYSSGVDPSASASLRFRHPSCFDVELIHDVDLVICLKGDRAVTVDSD